MESVEHMSLEWPAYVFYGASIVSLPLYFFVTGSLMRLRCISKTYRSTFYSILLQHCIADILAMLMFLFTWLFRRLPGFREFYFTYQDYYVLAATYNSIYYFINVRCCGIVLLSVHRYLIIIQPNSSLSQKVQGAPSWTIFTIFWIIPSLMSIVIFKDTEFTYDNMENMQIITDRSIISRNTLMSFIVVLTTCIICSISYGALFVFLIKRTVNLTTTLRREVRLAFQVLALYGAFLFMLAFCVAQNYFSWTQNSGPVYTMRSLYAIANCALSYVNPYCMLLLNREFAKNSIKAWKCKRYRVESTSNRTGGPRTLYSKELVEPA